MLVVVIVGLPLIFRKTLIAPLNNLLQGVTRVNEGNLQTTVPIEINDEIGFLTTSFNGMTTSLRELNEGLEEKVAQRTLELETEIVERKKAQAALVVARDRADAANRAKSVFLANMSHDLRTPLNAILGYAQILQRDQSDDNRPANIIERSGRHLLSLINDILDLAKVESGKLTLTLETVNLTRFLQRVGDLARPAAMEKGLKFHIELSIEDDVVVSADPKRLRQLLLNLLGNAASYTDVGSITLRAEQIGQQDRFRFSVTDTGIGIAAEELDDIFKPLHQTEAAQQRGVGTGLGLSISQQLAKLMGGELVVESHVGLGSTFSVELDLPVRPVQIVETATLRGRTLVANGAAPRIVISDDNSENRWVVEDMLRKECCQLKMKSTL